MPAAVPERGWPEYTRPRPVGPKLFSPRVPRGEGEPGARGLSKGETDYSGAHLAPSYPRAQKSLRCPEAGGNREARPGGRFGWDLRKCSPWGLGGELLSAAGTGLLAIFSSMEPGTLWKNKLGDNLQISGQGAGQSTR